MKEKKNTLKKSLSNVSNGGTLRRKMSLKSMQQTSPTSTLSSQNSTTYASAISSQIGSQTSISTLKVTKPNSAPPPPPPAVIKPSVPPPLPPISNGGSTNGGPSMMSKSMYEKPTEPKNEPERKKSIEADDVVKPLEEFKIDLNTESVSYLDFAYIEILLTSLTIFNYANFGRFVNSVNSIDDFDLVDFAD